MNPSDPEILSQISACTDRGALAALADRAEKAGLHRVTDAAEARRASLPARRQAEEVSVSIPEVVPVSLATLAGGEAEIRFQEALAEIGDDFTHPQVDPKSAGVITLKLKITKMSDGILVASVSDCTATSPKRLTKGRPIHRSGGVWCADPEETDEIGTRSLPFPQEI